MACTDGKQIVSEKKDKPIHDEETLAKILEAAYVLQEHNRGLQEKKIIQKKEEEEEPLAAKKPAPVIPPQAPPKPQPQKPTQKDDQAFTLAQIVETQQQIRTQHLPFEGALSVIVERATQISRAGGAAVAILDGDNVKYPANAGLLALPSGTEVPVEKALCAACLRSGKVFRCDDVNPELLLDTAECRQRGIGSLIAVPIFHNGGVAGALELYYPSAHAFADQEVHTGQLMAGLVTEALARNEEVSWKKSLATERAVMLEALEKLKPNLAALVDRPAAPAKESVPAITVPALDVSSSTFLCRKCGHQLVGQEQFCGNCGSPRNGDYEAAGLQSKVAALWQMQQEKKQPAFEHSADGEEMFTEPLINPEELHDDESAPATAAEPLPPSDFFTAAAPLPHDAFQPIEPDQAPVANEIEIADFENPQQGDLETFPHANTEPGVQPQISAETQASTALVKRETGTAWSSASKALDFLQQAGAAKNSGVWSQFWNTRRGDIYLAIAIVFVLGVIRWAIWSNHSVSATANPATAAAIHRKTAPDTDLSLFERTLIKLGLADAPEPPANKGNPRTQVWVDLHTALYYCPGADLYGKTPKGRFSTQRDAQLDSFEPAYRKACD
jgi:putative methionine-R-sulfoxide reductase with GAF domain